VRNALKQTVLLWTLLLLLTTWLGFFAVSAVVKYAVVVILVAVTAAVMAYWHKKKGQVVADDVWPSGKGCWTGYSTDYRTARCTAGSAGLWRYVGAPVH
jgi:purine-cytosine permease-like protein